ncbi:core histone macro-H2A.1 isoform X4 [Xyrichtys novacula]|uniref:Core histone macro-H2A.1 isoform X4 n=1 Tax=Xyrichtys novacula TaxID=13765 RepID=A0AAV1G601_XYRNO|nr:core histone macro-H2A.1 isoform X4 [Xyrichtys novacula]
MSSQGGKKPIKDRVIFPVGRLLHYMTRGLSNSAVGLSHCLNLGPGKKCCQRTKKGHITPRHIKFAIANDKELNQLLKGLTITAGGVLPNIHTELLAKVKKSTAKKMSGRRAGGKAKDTMLICTSSLLERRKPMVVNDGASACRGVHTSSSKNTSYMGGSVMTPPDH